MLQDTQALRDAIAKDGDTRLELDYELFKGVSIQLKETDKAEEKAAKLASMPAVKEVWPVRKVPMPDPKIEWVATPEDIKNADLGQSPIVSRAPPGEDQYPPHVMTQVDKLRADGVRGKGIKIAVVDTGVS